MYFKGEGVKKNEKLGLNWLHQAVYAGDIEAMYVLGNRYLSGAGLCSLL